VLGWWLDERELERVQRSQSGRREYAASSVDTLPGILCQCYWHRDYGGGSIHRFGSGTYADRSFPSMILRLVWLCAD